ncbi:MAG: DUF2779 domain-containing protein [Spirochaetes bacterium]|nr:DUF2779 domain-containing protein [Spirochaetota bacterium]
MDSPRYLTKSLFKTACECETKLYYAKKKEYSNAKLDDAFLEALAEGGYQVGALAKCYYPEGIDLSDYAGYNKPLTKTIELLQNDSVVIFEGAFKYENLFIRTDIIIKNGSGIDLIEVKSKSYGSDEDGNFLDKDGKYILRKWSPYLYDVAFQKYVISKAYPEFKIRSFLMMANKNSTANVDGLNQRFIINKKQDRINIKTVGDISKTSFGNELLTKVRVDDIIDLIFHNSDSKEKRDKEFSKWIDYLSATYNEDKRIDPKVSSICGNCEFHCNSEDDALQYKDGFKECLQRAFGLKPQELDQPLIFNIWNFRGKDALLNKNTVFMKDVGKNDIIKSENNKQRRLDTQNRQWLQIRKIQENDPSPYFDKDGFKEEMDSWEYPLHCIDFETSAVAIPFNSGMKPYETIAFQFSHHIINKDGSIEHIGEYINTERGKFPNFDFVRALKSDLSSDSGTIFRYASHENTILNHIYRQLQRSDEPDKNELCHWIKTISQSSDKNNDKWIGDRNMVDMLELVKKYYYHPATKGSNSIKAVFPAIISTCDFLKEKYNNPIDSIPAGFTSRNYPSDWRWVRTNAKGEIVDPYKLLPSIFEGIGDDSLDLFISDEFIADGGTAMMAYARMQFSEVSDLECRHIIKGLLKYCELDTLAMVMILEHWITNWMN